MDFSLWILLAIIWILLGIQGQRMFVRYMRYQFKGSTYKGDVSRWITAIILGPLSILIVLHQVYTWHSSDDIMSELNREG